MTYEEIRKAKEIQCMKIASEGAAITIYRDLFKEMGIRAPESFQDFSDYFFSPDAINDLKQVLRGGNHAR